MAATAPVLPARAPTAFDVVLRDGTTRLLHFRGRAGATSAPLLLIPSLINKWYVLDLRQGSSLVEALTAGGIDTYCLDWVGAEDEDRHQTWDDLVAKIARAMRFVSRATGAPRVGLLGYCMGGTLAAIAASLTPERVLALGNLAGPIDFAHAGALGEMVSPEFFDVDAIAGAGNVSALQMQSGFAMLRPTLALAKWVGYLDRAHDPGHREAFSALEAWSSDNVAFPAAAYVTYIRELYQKNLLALGEHHVAGRRADLGRITCPVLSVVASNDTICPPAAATALNELCGSAQKEVLGPGRPRRSGRRLARGAGALSEGGGLDEEPSRGPPAAGDGAAVVPVEEPGRVLLPLPSTHGENPSTMAQSSSLPKPPTVTGPQPPTTGGPGITLTGGAAILAPVTAFPTGVPSNALILIPLGPNGAAIEKQIVNGPVALTQDEVWKLLGFNGPAVQVQDEQGRPIAIGLEDLLAGLEKHWTESPDDLGRGRIFAQELIKHGRHAKAETVLGKIVALGGDGEDWLALGVTQLAQAKNDKAEGTLKGAQNLMKDNPFPSLHLAKVYKAKGDKKGERESVERALQIEPGSVDAWAYLTTFLKETEGEDKALARIEELANAPVNAKSAAPYVALQGFFSADAATRDKAIGFAKKGVDRAPNDPIALLCLSALYGQGGKLDEVVKLLAPHEASMQKDVRLAHNYFEALFQSKDMPRVTALLNKLATSPVREVKQFAIERSRAISQLLAQQQQALAQAAKAGGAPV